MEGELAPRSCPLATLAVHVDSRLTTPVQHTGTLRALGCSQHRIARRSARLRPWFKVDFPFETSSLRQSELVFQVPLVSPGTSRSNPGRDGRLLVPTMCRDCEEVVRIVRSKEGKERARPGPLKRRSKPTRIPTSCAQSFSLSPFFSRSALSLGSLALFPSDARLEKDVWGSCDSFSLISSPSLSLSSTVLLTHSRFSKTSEANRKSKSSSIIVPVSVRSGRSHSKAVPIADSRSVP